jgi:DNA polymerase-3 subunit alpha
MGVGEQLYDIKTGAKKHHDPPLVLRRKRHRNGNNKPMRFVSLHHHSTFSYKDGFALPEAHVRRAEELQMGAFALTEHGNVSSHVKFERAIGDSGIKPIFGCEVYTGKVGEGASATKYHLTLIAKDQEGYENLLKLVSRSYAEGFYYEPTVSWHMLREHSKGLVILSGCQGSYLFCSLVGGKKIKPESASYDRAKKVARRFKAAFGDDYFIEVQAFPELELSRQANPLLARLARELGIRLVATMDCHYTALEESEMQAILHNIRGGTRKTLEEQAREWGYEVPLCPPPSDRAIYRRLKGTGLSHDEAVAALVSTEEIAQDCNVTLPKLEMVRFPIPNGYESAQDYWDHLLQEGWERRGFDSLSGYERQKRVRAFKREKSIIEEKGYVDYMLIVADAIMFMKRRNIPVWLRGSAGASLICYLLGISDMDPIPYPMLRFERFIDLNRADLPDIDADFPSEDRGVLRDYLVTKYGERCVSNLGTFQYFKPKLALDDTARVFRIPKFKIERVKDFLIERSSGDLRASSGIEDTIAEFEEPRKIFEEHPELNKSFDLEGNVKGHGIHAAGLVISNDDVRKVSSVILREVPKGSGRFIEVLGVDKYDAEYLGMVKMDFLGLATMSLLKNSLRYLDMSLDDLWQIPLDDQEVYDAFKRTDVVGIFQYDGRACRYVCSAVRPDNFWEVCDVIALGRPGALHNGAARDYAEIKHGNKVSPNLHPSFAPILLPTYGQIVYQEQILRIVREVGNFDWTAASEIRRIIAKKHGEQAFNRRKKLFMRGAATVHERMNVPKMRKVEAEALWGDMITAGSYGFNAAHAREYGALGYFTMWIKVHHPDIFYATALRAYGDKKEHDLLRDCAKKGIRVIKPSPKRSDVSWTPVRGKKVKSPTIRAGFDEIEGIGEKTAAQILAYREAHGLSSWAELQSIRGIGPKTVEKIEGWLSQDDPFGAFALDGNIRDTRRAIKKGALRGLPTPTHTSTDIPVEQGRETSVVWLGTMLDRNIRDIFEQNRARKGEELKREEVKDPQLNEFALLTCEDENDQLLLKIDRWAYPRFKEAIFNFRFKQDLMLVEGVRPAYVSARQIKVKKLWVIEP